jgi:hypothetical protein
MRLYLLVLSAIVFALTGNAYAQPSTNGPSGTGPEGSPPGVVSGSGLNPGQNAAYSAKSSAPRRHVKRKLHHR